MTRIVKALAVDEIVDGEQVHIKKGEHLPDGIAQDRIAVLDAIGALEPDATESGEEPSVDALLLTADEAALIAQGVDSGHIMSDDEFAAWIAGSTAAEILKHDSTDVVFAKRALQTERARGDEARKGLVSQLAKRIGKEA